MDLPAGKKLGPYEIVAGGAVGGYDVSPDGQTFVMTRSEHANPTEIRVVVGWLGAPGAN